MTNPFDNDETTFLVLVNDEGRHSLWPDSHPVPLGWRVVFGSDTRDRCTAYVEENWTALRPAGRAAGDRAAGSPS